MKFAEATPSSAIGRCLDLGSGGGIPGLVLAILWPESSWLLLDASKKRTTFLARAAVAARVEHRVAVLCSPAEDAGRQTQYREQFDLVVSRSFAKPAIAAECGAPLVRVGGHMVVSEPPQDTERWHSEAVRLLGLTALEADAAGVAVFAKTAVTPERFPRRAGIPQKRPLF